MAEVNLGQDKINENHPCRAEMIEKARKDGLRSLEVWEMPVYYWQRRQCRNELDNNKALSALNLKQIDEDFENSKMFRGFTSCCAYLTIAMFLASAASTVL